MNRSGFRGLLRRRTLLVLATFLAALSALAVLLALQALTVRRELQAAEAAVFRMRAAVLASGTGSVAGPEASRARQELEAAQQHAARAREAVDGLLWGAAVRLPVLGDDAHAVAAVTRGVDVISSKVLPVLLGTAERLRPGALRPDGDRVDVRLLAAAAGPLAEAAATVAGVERQLATVPDGALFPPVADALARLRSRTGELAGQVQTAALATRLVPPLLGAEGPRRYFLAIQNPAEARGTGGLLGAYGVLEAVDGRFRIAHLGPNTQLRNPGSMPLDLGPDFRELYGSDPALWVNANLSPHFPYAARLWLEMWHRQHGERLDGVFATDPVALRYVLEAVGPVRLPGGETVTADNVVDLTLRQVYERYPKSNDLGRRDAFLQQVAGSVVARLFTGDTDVGRLLPALARAAAEHRLLVYSSHAEEQKALAALPVGGIFPEEPGPFAAVIVNNGGGNKLDYHLERRMSYRLVGCDGARRRTEIVVELTNGAPAGLSDYARGEDNPHGDMRQLVAIHTTRGSRLQEAAVDGQKISVTAGREFGRPVFSTRVPIERGQTRRFSVRLVEPPAPPGGLSTWRQPLVKELRFQADRPPCPGCAPPCPASSPAPAGN